MIDTAKALLPVSSIVLVEQYNIFIHQIERGAESLGNVFKDASAIKAYMCKIPDIVPFSECVSINDQLGHNAQPAARL
jgi:hypothetical protein